jgi:L-seryl-tRNA(Ser) seleniumtransferase
MMMNGECSRTDSEVSNLYRLLPSVHDVLLAPNMEPILEVHSRASVLDSLRTVLLRLKQQIAAGQHTHESLTAVLASLVTAVSQELYEANQFSLQRVINATGVVLHTNLGRAPLSASALEHIRETASGFSNLEFDLASGQRSRRDVHAEQLLLRLLRARAGSRDKDDEPRAAVIVNNCAAATFLALNSIAEGTEVLVSRGELVEIGGGFRIPEILAKSQAHLREVGTTNRTRVADYESAITQNTSLIVRVHQSNFSIEGFTERPALVELIALARRARIPLFDDQGTGSLDSLHNLGIRAEPTLVDSFRSGSDLIAASGDKLLGGPQCGLLVGRVDLIERIRKNPLLRAFRVDKLTYAALEATLMDHLLDRGPSLPIVRMLHTTPDEILARCEKIQAEFRSDLLTVEVVPVQSVIGGGTAPAARLDSSALALRHHSQSSDELLSSLRTMIPPIVGRISEDLVLLDLRTVEPEFDANLSRLLEQLAGGKGNRNVRTFDGQEVPANASGGSFQS